MLNEVAASCVPVNALGAISVLGPQIEIPISTSEAFCVCLVSILLK